MKLPDGSEMIGGGPTPEEIRANVEEACRQPIEADAINPDGSPYGEAPEPEQTGKDRDQIAVGLVVRCHADWRKYMERDGLEEALNELFLRGDFAVSEAQVVEAEDPKGCTSCQGTGLLCTGWHSVETCARCGGDGKDPTASRACVVAGVTVTEGLAQRARHIAACFLCESNCEGCEHNDKLSPGEAIDTLNEIADLIAKLKGVSDGLDK